jgi:hypothetical protein
MAERTGCPILLSLWSYVAALSLSSNISKTGFAGLFDEIHEGLKMAGLIRTHIILSQFDFSMEGRVLYQRS